MPKTLISVGKLIDESWDIYRAHFFELISISGWLLATAILSAIALAFYPTATALQLSTDLHTSEIIGVIIFSLTTFVVTPILSFWIYTSLTRAMKMFFATTAIYPKKAMREGQRVFFPAAVTSIMVVLMIFLALVIGFAPPVILAAIGSITNLSFLVVLANLLLIIGIFVALFLAIKWTVYYFFAPLLTILENVRGKVALESSRRLIEGRFGQVLIRAVVPKLVFVFFGVFAMYLISYLVNVLLSASGGLNLDLQLRLITMTQTIVPIVIASLINPLILISDMLLLRSLKD